MKNTTWMSAIFFFFFFLSPVFSLESNRAQVGENPQDVLSFVWSEEVVHYPAHEVKPGVDAVIPGFASQVFITHWQGQGHKLLLNEGLSHLSEPQQTFMKNHPFYQVVCTDGTAYEGFNLIRLYAVNREQAGKMAHVMIDTLTRQAQQRRFRLMQERRRVEDRIQRHCQGCPRIAHKLGALKKTMARHLDVERYRTLAAQDAAEVAQERIVALTTESDQIRAEVAECYTVVESLEGHVEGLKDDNLPDTGWAIARLETVAVENKARLEGLQARMTVINQTLGEEKELRSLYQQMQELQQQQRRLTQAMEKDKDRLANLTQRLTDSEPELWEPVIFENRIEICAVQ